MILPRRTVYLLLLAIATATILFRYPVGTYHELGSDTTFIHSLADSVVQNGRGLWVLHPLSYFGLYALSYPSAMPFFFAEGNLAAGIPLEGIALLFGWIIGLVGSWGAFLVARWVRRDDIFALMVATLFPLAPFFVKDTFWVMQTRGFVVALLPVFLLLLVRSLKTRGIRDVALAIGLFVVLATIHRMGFLAFFFLIAFAFALPFHKVTQKLRFALVKFERPARYAIVASAFLGFFGMFYVQFLFPGAAGANVVEQYGSGAFFEGESFPILLANMGVSLSGKIGPLFPVALLGIAAYVWRRPKEVADKFLLTATILFLPLLSLRDYIGEFLIPLFVLLVVVGFLWVAARTKRRELVTVVVVLVLTGSLTFSWVMKDYWREKYDSDSAISSSSYQGGLYVLYDANGTILATEGLSGGQIAAISGRPVLPLGGASLHWTGPQQLTWGYLNSSSIYVRPLPLGEISFNTDEIYVAEGIRNAETDWETMLFYNSPVQARQLFDRYHIQYVLTPANRPDYFYSYGFRRGSPYLASALPGSSYVVYDNGAVLLWLRA